MYEYANHGKVPTARQKTDLGDHDKAIHRQPRLFHPDNVQQI